MAKKKTKYVYFFGGGKAEGKAAMKALLGGKGANLAEMSALGLPVPAGLHHHHRGVRPVLQARPQVARRAGARRSPRTSPGWRSSRARPSATAANPLLVSVRSGAAASMPGMMDTVLNLGLNDETLRR